jgi:hypothetical protein
MFVETNTLLEVLWKNHFVPGRGDLAGNLRFPRAPRHVDAGDLVVEAAVAAVTGHVLDHGIKYFDIRRTTCQLQAPNIGQYRAAKRMTEIFRHAGVLPDAVVLDVDDQERRVCRVYWRFAAQHGHSRRNSS